MGRGAGRIAAATRTAITKQPGEARSVPERARALDGSLPLAEALAFNAEKTVTVRDASGCFKYTKNRKRTDFNIVVVSTF